MKRREFIALAAGAATALPLSSLAQSGIPSIGFLGSSSPRALSPFIAAFRQGLKQMGYVEGENVAIEFRWPKATTPDYQLSRPTS
jgi:hypothetical protein